MSVLYTFEYFVHNNNYNCSLRIYILALTVSLDSVSLIIHFRLTRKPWISNKGLVEFAILLLAGLRSATLSHQTLQWRTSVKIELTFFLMMLCIIIFYYDMYIPCTIIVTHVFTLESYA